MSKSVDKQPQNQPAHANTKHGAPTSGSAQHQYSMLPHNSKDLKLRDSAKRRRDASGASTQAGPQNGSSQVYGNNGPNVKEKRLS